MAATIRLVDGVQLAPETRLVKAAECALFQDAHTLWEDTRQRSLESAAAAQADIEFKRRAIYHAAREEGRREASREMLSTVGSAADYLARVESGLVDVVMSSLRKIVGQIDDRELTLRVVRETLAGASNLTQAVVTVNSGEVDSVKQHVSQLLAENGRLDYIEVQGSDGIDVGCCRIETDMGVIDANLETQLLALEESLREREGD